MPEGLYTTHSTKVLADKGSLRCQDQFRTSVDSWSEVKPLAVTKHPHRFSSAGRRTVSFGQLALGNSCLRCPPPQKPSKVFSICFHTDVNPLNAWRSEALKGRAAFSDHHI